MSFIKPMKAKKDNCEGIPEGNYLYEVKWDGIRAIMVWDHYKGLTIYSKSGRDISENFPELTSQDTIYHTFHCDSAVIDTEIVCLKNDVADFGAITSRFHLGSTAGIKKGMIDNPATAMVFDILELNGRDLTKETLNVRKGYLGGHIEDGHIFHIPLAHYSGEKLYEREKTRGAEGIIAKRATSTYQPGRRLKDWLKVKIMYEEEVIVYGFTAGKGKRIAQFGSLLFKGLDGRPAGKVGTGFTDAELEDMTIFLNICGIEETKPGTYKLKEPFHAIVKGMKKNKSGAIREPVFVRIIDD